MIQEEYVSFETAKMLEELGFDEPCDWAYYKDGKIAAINAINSTLSRGYISRPTQSLAARWLREVHKLHIFCMQSNHPYSEPSADEWEWCYIVVKINQPNVYLACKIEFATYEQAMEAGLQKALEIIKKRKDEQKRTTETSGRKVQPEEQGRTGKYSC